MKIGKPHSQACSSRISISTVHIVHTLRFEALYIQTGAGFLYLAELSDLTLHFFAIVVIFLSSVARLPYAASNIPIHFGFLLHDVLESGCSPSVVHMEES